MSYNYPTTFLAKKIPLSRSGSTQSNIPIFVLLTISFFASSDVLACIFALMGKAVKKLFQSRIFGNFSWLIADRLLRLVLGLFVSVTVARYLGPTDLGLWNYYLSFTLFFSVFGSLGIESILTRELVKGNRSKDELMASALALRLSGSLVGLVTCLIVFYLYRDADSRSVLMFSLVASLLLMQSLDIFDIYFKSRLEAKFSSIARSSAFVMVSILKLVWVYHELDLNWFLGLTTVELFIGAFALAVIYRKRSGQILFSQARVRTMLYLIREGLPLAISGLMILLYMRIDQVMVTDMVSESANGIYSSAVKMIEVIYFVPIALGESFFPAIVYDREHRVERYNETLTGFYSIMTYVGVVATVLVCATAIPLMSLLFGVAFEGSGMVLFILGLSLYATCTGTSVTRYLTAEGLFRIILWRSIIGLSVNITLNFLLIDKYGYIGAAYASLISYYVIWLSIALFADSRSQFALLLKAFNYRTGLNDLKQRFIEGDD